MKRLVYVESTGTQYIDTGFKPNQNTRLVIDAQPVGASATQFHCIFGCRGGGLYWELYKASASNETLYYFYGPTYGPGFTIDWTARQIFEINKNVATVGDQTLTYDEQTFQLGYTAFLGADNNGGSVAGITPMRTYSCQIYDNDSLIRDFIPVLDNEGTACLYDQVGETYYYNAGTGSFTAGPEVFEGRQGRGPRRSGGGGSSAKRVWISASGNSRRDATVTINGTACSYGAYEAQVGDTIAITASYIYLNGTQVATDSYTYAVGGDVTIALGYMSDRFAYIWEE